jgi:hypothetical protein
VLCAENADISKSFTDVTVHLPDTLHSEPVIMEPGDVLFFNGSVIHGNKPNTSHDRFGRSLIGHYVTGETREVSKFYKPVLDLSGNDVIFEESEGGGPCGKWIEKNGETHVVVA